jgi:hypothetical protein
MDETTHRRRPRLNIEAIFRLTELADYIIPFAIRAVSELGVADTLSGGPKPVDAIAKAVGADADALYRTLRALACKEIFVETEPGIFALTPMADFLRSDHPLSLRDAYRPIPADIDAWAEIVHALRSGQPAFEKAHGEGYWERLQNSPQERALFDKSQQAHTRLELVAFRRVLDWGRFGTIVDVGGGNGAFLAGLLKQAPLAHGILSDVADAVDTADSVFEAAGVSCRAKVQAADFFTDLLPTGGNAYILKRILYGWHDDDAGRVLAAVRAAMPDESRLFVIEPIDEPDHNTEIARRLDLTMLVMKGCGARSFTALDTLFAAADLKRVAIHPTPLYPVVEVAPI